MSVFSWTSSSPVVERLGWTLLHSIWEVTAAAVVLSVVLAAVARRAFARMRYAIASGTLALLIGSLAMTFLFIPSTIQPEPAAVRATLLDPDASGRGPL